MAELELRGKGWRDGTGLGKRLNRLKHAGTKTCRIYQTFAVSRPLKVVSEPKAKDQDSSNTFIGSRGLSTSPA